MKILNLKILKKLWINHVKNCPNFIKKLTTILNQLSRKFEKNLKI